MMKENPKDSIKESIIKAARDVFLRYGFFKTTMEDIGKAIGKDKSTLYYYFTSKEDILRGVIDSEIDSMRNEALSLLSSSDDIYGKILKYFNFRMEKMYFLIEFYGKSEREYIEHFAFTEDFRQLYEDEERLFIANLLKEGIDSGELYEMDIESTASTISISMKGFEFPWILKRGGDEIKNKLREYLNLFYYGIRKR